MILYTFIFAINSLVFKKMLITLVKLIINSIFYYSSFSLGLCLKTKSIWQAVCRTGKCI